MQYAPVEERLAFVRPVGIYPRWMNTISLRGAVNFDCNELKAVEQGTGKGAGTNTSGFSALLGGYSHSYFKI